MKILIDMIELRAAMIRNPSLELPEALCGGHGNTEGLRSVRELALFRFTCRRCEDAPCIAVCPAEALEKDAEGIIKRHTNLCISCKSCVTICPFGTIMTDFFKHHQNKDLFYDLLDHEEARKFVEACPPGTARFTSEEENPAANIWKLNERILIHDYMYVTEKE